MGSDTIETTKQRFIEFDETRIVPELTEGDKDRHRGQARELIRVLADGQWHSTANLVQRVGHRFSTSINYQRDRGYVIEKRRGNGASWEYRCLERTEMRLVTDDWQSAYYKSAHWRDKREKRMRFDDYQCCDCGTKTNLEVHHWRYDLYAERIQDLMTFCAKCHKRLHDHDGVRISFPTRIAASVFDTIVIDE